MMTSNKNNRYSRNDDIKPRVPIFFVLIIFFISRLFLCIFIKVENKKLLFNI